MVVFDPRGDDEASGSRQRTQGNRNEDLANKYGVDDPLALHTSDHSALVLVAELLDEKNYITWSRNMIIALDTRDKLRFLNGEVAEPIFGAPNYRQWQKVNSMLISWILNSMTKKLARGFMFTTKACTLWKTIKERFGQSDGSLENQLKKDLINLKQGHNSVSVYFHELSGLRDEFSTLRPRKFCGCCNCGIVKEILEQDERDKLHQFIIALNTEYAHVCNQILVMDPLPSVEKAFSMVSKVERQNMVQDDNQETQRNSALITYSAMAVKSFRNLRGSYEAQMNSYLKPSYGAREVLSYGGSDRPPYVRDKVPRKTVKRPDLKCDYCGDLGHLKTTCFKIYGFPDWYQGSRDTSVRNKLLGTQVAHAATSSSTISQQDIPLDSPGSLQDMVLNLQMQVDKLMKGKMEAGSSSFGAENINYAHFQDFAGPQD